MAFSDCRTTSVAKYVHCIKCCLPNHVRACFSRFVIMSLRLHVSIIFPQALYIGFVTIETPFDGAVVDYLAMDGVEVETDVQIRFVPWLPILRTCWSLIPDWTLQNEHSLCDQLQYILPPMAKYTQYGWTSVVWFRLCPLELQSATQGEARIQLSGPHTVWTIYCTEN